MKTNGEANTGSIDGHRRKSTRASEKPLPPQLICDIDAFLDRITLYKKDRSPISCGEAQSYLICKLKRMVDAMQDFVLKACMFRC